MGRILLTGFEPFGTNETNVSQMILKQIESRLTIQDPWHDCRSSVSGNGSMEVYLEKQLLTVDEVGSRLTAKRLDSGDTWDLIIHMGLCESCDKIRFELTAQNKLDMRIPDNSGRQLKATLIGKTDLHVDKTFAKSLTHPPLKEIILSNDAGTYLCNETYYRTLESLGNKTVGKSTKACFIHFPKEEIIPVQDSINILKKIIGRILFKPVIDVVGALLVNEDKIMLAKRNTTSEMPGVWEFPGGKIEPGESEYEAIAREIEEEFDWNVSPKRLVSSAYHEYSEFAINLKIIEVSMDFSEDLSPNSRWTSHDEIGWFNDIDGINLAQADYEIAAKILNEINAK